MNHVSPEELFTPQQIAERLKLSLDTVRRIFRDEPGVIKVETKLTLVRSKRYKRPYSTIRIPASVFERVCSRMTVQAA